MIKNYQNDPELRHAFENCSIILAIWDHTLHLRVSFIYAKQEGLESTITHMRNGIKKLNLEHNTPETPSRGYNETLTQAWVRIIFKRVQEGNYTDSLDFVEYNKDLLNPGYVEKYYDLESLKTSEAKNRFVAPKNNLRLA